MNGGASFHQHSPRLDASHRLLGCHRTRLFSALPYPFALGRRRLPSRSTAIHILNGKVPYRDFWYDKPPLCAVFYLIIGGYPGWPLRILDAVYILVACYLAYVLARDWWHDELEGYAAALLLAFFTTFYLPSAVIPLAADALMIVPHFAAIYCARRKLPFWAGMWAGIALLFNTKALFVLATCAIFVAPQFPVLLSGFALPLAVSLLAALLSGAWAGYYEQVWRWGFTYAQGSPVLHPVTTGLRRTANWIGFHAALVAGAVYGLFRATRSDRNQLLVWIALSYAAVCLGSRFAPHYFLQLLPPLVIAASRVSHWHCEPIRSWPRRCSPPSSSFLLSVSVPDTCCSQSITCIVAIRIGLMSLWISTANMLRLRSVLCAAPVTRCLCGDTVPICTSTRA